MNTAKTKKDDAPATPCCHIDPIGNNQAKVTLTFYSRFNPEENGMFNCFIPGFDIYFTAPSREAIDMKAKAIMDMFLSHFITGNKRGVRHLLIHLHKLGFKSKAHQIDMKDFMHNRVKAANFKIVEERIDQNFVNAHGIQHNMEATIPV